MVPSGLPSSCAAPAASVVSWRPDVETHLGTASLLVGDYASVNFTLLRSTDGEALQAEDEPLNHVAILRGVAARAGEEREFLAVIDITAPFTQIAGVPFDGRVHGGMGARLSLYVERALGSSLGRHDRPNLADAEVERDARSPSAEMSRARGVHQRRDRRSRASGGRVP